MDKKKTVLYEYCHALSNYLIVVSAGHLNKNNIGIRYIEPL